MKIKIIYFVLISSLLICFKQTQAAISKGQIESCVSTPSDTIKKKAKFKRFYTGFIFANNWTDLPGYTAEDRYYKPSLGATLKFEYMIKPWIGVGLGLGFQQRGFGALYHNVVPVPESPAKHDSTYRFRVRTNNIMIPIGLTFKVPLFKGCKLSGFAGTNINFIISGERTYVDVESGNHESTNEFSMYRKMDYLAHASLGFDVDAGGFCTLRVHCLYNEGLRSIYRPDPTKDFSGHNRSIGIELGVLF